VPSAVGVPLYKMTMMMMMMAHQKQTGDSVERQDIDKTKKKRSGDNKTDLLYLPRTHVVTGL